MMPDEGRHIVMPQRLLKHPQDAPPYSWQRAVALPVFFLALGLYVLTLAPTVVTIFDDSLEFQLITYLMGIAHPTGYPLYTLLGWLFTRIPVGDVAFRVNLLSAVFGALTIALIYLVGLELIVSGRLRKSRSPEPGTRQAWAEVSAAAIGALTLVVSPVFWSQATIAEVYTLNAAFIAGMLWLLLGGAYPPSEGRLLALAFLFGLSLTHHRTTLLMLPALVLYLWPAFPSWRLRTGIKMIAALMAPLLLYLYIPVRGHVGSLDGTYTNTLEGFWKHVTAGGYGVFIFENPFAAERGAGYFLSLFLRQFGPIGLVTGLAGLAVLDRHRARELTATAFVTYLIFNIFYRVADIEVFFIPLFVIWAIWIGVATGWVLTGPFGASTGRVSRWRLPVTLLAITLLVGQPIIAFSNNLPDMDRSSDWAVADYAMDMIHQPMEPNSSIVGILGEVTLIRYFQETQGLRRDLELVAADEEAERLATVARLVDEGQAVYLTRELPGAPAQWSLGAIGPLIRVFPQPVLEVPTISKPVGYVIVPEITLYGYDVSRPPSSESPSPARLTLVWQVTAPITHELKVSARLVNVDGQIVAQADAVPVHFAYPTTNWRPGEFISDVYDLVVPDTIPAGEYTPVIILYDPAQGAAEIGRVTLASIYLP
jgi:hypothetical protein